MTSQLLQRWMSLSTLVKQPVVTRQSLYDVLFTILKAPSHEIMMTSIFPFFSYLYVCTVPLPLFYALIILPFSIFFRLLPSRSLSLSFVYLSLSIYYSGPLSCFICDCFDTEWMCFMLFFLPYLPYHLFCRTSKIFEKKRGTINCYWGCEKEVAKWGLSRVCQKKGCHCHLLKVQSIIPYYTVISQYFFLDARNFYRYQVKIHHDRSRDNI